MVYSTSSRRGREQNMKKWNIGHRRMIHDTNTHQKHPHCAMWKPNTVPSISRHRVREHPQHRYTRYCINIVRTTTKLGFWEVHQYLVPGAHLHISTEQACPAITERYARSWSIQTFVPSSSGNDSRLRQSWTYVVDAVARGTLHRSLTRRDIPHWFEITAVLRNSRRSVRVR